MYISRILVVVFLIALTVIGCKKHAATISPTNSAKNYTSKIGGVRIWYGMQSIGGGFSSSSGYIYDTTYVTDTFAIIALNDTVISFDISTIHPYVNIQTDALPFVSSNDSEYIFQKSGSVFNGPYSEIRITYNYIYNSVSYYFFVQTQGGGNSIILNTP